MADQPKNDLPGKWYGGLSLQPLKEAGGFFKRPVLYTRALRHEAGCPIFRAHPGVRATYVTDHAGLTAAFEAPPEQLDRELEPGFGPMKVQVEALLDGTVPAVVTHAGNHGPARALIDGAMKLRAAAFRPACQKVLDGGWPVLAEVASTHLEHAILGTVVGIVFDWLFGIKEGPSGADHEVWLEEIIGLKTDTWLTNLLAQRLKPAPSAAVRDYSQRWMDRIRKSEPYPSFEKLGAELGVPAAEVAPHLLFGFGFNATGGVNAGAYPAVAQIHADHRLRGRLAEELAGFSGDVDALDQLPYLDAFFLEVVRMYSKPRHYFRRVMRAMSLPTSTGDSVPLAEGTRVCLMAPMAHQDPTVFGPDATVFDPERYFRNPELKRKVYPYGPPAGGPSPYYCAGAGNGEAQRLWKTVFASLARNTEWRLDPSPMPDPNSFTGVVPGSWTWHRR